MSLSKKSLVYFDYMRKKRYRFKRNVSCGFGCRSCKMMSNAMCYKYLDHPIQIDKTVYVTINALCRRVNGDVIKRYIVV